jgi:hypothetical protein
MAKKLKHAEQYHQQNLMAATILASDPTKYPTGSLMSVWADIILTRAADVKDVDVGPLLGLEAA